MSLSLSLSFSCCACVCGIWFEVGLGWAGLCCGAFLFFSFLSERRGRDVSLVGGKVTRVRVVLRIQMRFSNL